MTTSTATTANTTTLSTLTYTFSWHHGSYDPSTYANSILTIDLIEVATIKKLSSRFLFAEFVSLSAHFELFPNNPFESLSIVAAWSPRTKAEPTSTAQVRSTPGSVWHFLNPGTSEAVRCEFSGPISTNITDAPTFGERAKLFVHMAQFNRHPYVYDGSKLSQPALGKHESLNIQFHATVRFGAPTGQLLE
jgi:hypothetical protein